MGIIEIDNVSLSLGGKKILNGLTMDIWEGHVHAVVGPNGAGKSTLSYTIMGLPGYRDFEGDIRFNGSSIKGMGIDERARLGITLGWQEPARFEGLRVRDFIGCSARDKSEKNLTEVLEKVSLGPQYLDRAVDRTLSGGERKKVELASIIAMEPRCFSMNPIPASMSTPSSAFSTPLRCSRSAAPRSFSSPTARRCSNRRSMCS